jgi:uncharacterized membrane protein YedE/YeeE
MTSVLAFLSGPSLLWSGLGFGILFGWLLHRGGVTNPQVIVGQFLFRDFTVLKVMFTAIVVGGVGVAVLHANGLANFHIKPAAILAVVTGGLIFGVGMALLGYCPGTGVAAMATGRLDAIAGFAGMLGGAAAYAFVYPWVAEHLLKVGDLGKKRLPEVLGGPDWLWYAGLVLVAAGVFALVSRIERGRA